MITVTSTPELVVNYHTLLVSDWTKSFPQEVLSLLWATVGGQVIPGELQNLWQLLAPNGADTFPWKFFQTAVERIANCARCVKLTALPELVVDVVPAKRVSQLTQQANKLSVYLTFAAHTTVAGNTAFLADVQALAFQAALHCVLPELRRKHEFEHALLLHSAVLFAIGYSAYEPAHYAYLMSMIHDYLGDQEQRLRSLLAAFRFTSPEDHSYLTKAQEYWTELLDQKKPAEAERFLLSLHRWALPAQQDEVLEMVVEGFTIILKNQRVNKV